MESKNRVCFIAHGGGPMPLLDPCSHREMIETLQKLTLLIDKPKAIVVISAHWEQQKPTITTANNPPLIYDYSGFPEQAYQIEYSCSGEPHLAKQLYQVLTSAGIDAQLDMERGFDHGVYVPLKIMYPDADIPCIQLSLVKGLDPQQHIEIGQALANLDNDNLLILGSGFSFHNMREFMSGKLDANDPQNREFEEWLVDTMANQSIDENQRCNRLINWQQAPSASYCHPRAEHLLPLHVCYGASQQACHQFFEIKVLNKLTSMYLW